MQPFIINTKMLRKTILFFIIIALALSGFAQKSKRKSISKAPKSSYFTILINDTIPAARYCPDEMLKFDFTPKDTNILEYCWSENYHDTLICNITPIELSFPIIGQPPRNFTITLKITYTMNSDTICDTLTHNITIDYFRIILDTTVCQGREITVPTQKGDITFTDVQEDCYTLWDTLKLNPGSPGCDTLVHWHIEMKPYISEIYEISSCDSVVWGFNDPNSNTLPKQIIVRRPPDYEGDYTDSIQRIFFATDPNSCCDTLKTLKFTIVETGNLKINFNQDDFCKGEEMEGTITLETNFTAFDWKYLDKKDSVWTVLKDNSIKVYDPGYYEVYAYMDTSLYDTLRDLRIVATTCAMMADTIVADCTLEIPNVFTPNGDDKNAVFGIKKLNLLRNNELVIYDRWGKEVFRQKNYKCVFKGGVFHNIESAFDGRSRGGQNLPEGTYYYAFKYDAIPKNKAKTYVGVVVIVR